MIENSTKAGGHYKVGVNSTSEFILIQVQNKFGDQAREVLTRDEGEQLLLLLKQALEEIG